MSVPGIKLDSGGWFPGILVKNADSTERVRFTTGVGYSGTSLTTSRPSNSSYSVPFTLSDWNGQYPAWSFKEYFNNGVITTSRVITLLNFADNLHLEAVLTSGSDHVLIRFQKSGTYAFEIRLTSRYAYLAIIPFVTEKEYLNASLGAKCGIMEVIPTNSDNISFGNWLLEIDRYINSIIGQTFSGLDYIFDRTPSAAANMIGFENSLYPVADITLDYTKPYSTNLVDAEFECRPSYYYYDGAAKEPQVFLRLNDQLLTEGVDYTLTYHDNVDVGLGYALATAVSGGEYTGTKKCFFPIYSSPTSGNLPYSQLEPSGPGGGTMDVPGASDVISLPAVPTLNMADCGFCRIYNPTKQQLIDLSHYLWTDASFLQTITNHVKQLLENPMDGIICLNLLPCTIGDGGTEEFRLLYVPTGINLTKAASQFVPVNCGFAQVKAEYGSALDYSPYTRVSLFLPYVGMVSLSPDEVMGHTLSINYRIDIVTGGCVAMVSVDGDVMYQFSGHCAISMPLTGSDYSNLAAAMIQTVKAAATIGAAGAAGAAAEGMLALRAEQKTSGGGSGAEVSASSQMKQGILKADVNMNKGAAAFGSMVAGPVMNTVSAVMGSKPEIARTGTFSGNTGYLGVRRPYLVIERARLCNPREYGKYNGYPSMQTVKLGDVSGFTQVQQIQLTGMGCTNPELDEIHSLLKAGVIL